LPGDGRMTSTLGSYSNSTEMNMLRKLKVIYHRQPPWAKKLVAWTLWPYRALMKLEARHFQMVWLLSGQETHSDLPITLAYGGSESTRHYLARLMFKTAPELTYLGKYWVRPKAGALALVLAQADLSVVAISKNELTRGPDFRGFVLPVWLRGDMDLSLVNLKNRGLMSDLSRIRRHNFSYDVGGGRDIIIKFYEDMYAPFVKIQYGEECCPTSLTDFLKDIDHKKLLMVRKDGEWVAGELWDFRGNHVILMELGVRPDRPDLVKAGVIQAIYYFRYQYFKDKPDLRIDLMGARPFYDDGLIYFKKRWGYRPTGWMALGGMGLRILRDTESVRSFLHHHPFIAVEAGKLAGHVFMEKPTDQVEALVRLRRHLWPGLANVHGHYFASAKEKEAIRDSDGAVDLGPIVLGEKF
jgi:hypothetical protein